MQWSSASSSAEHYGYKWKQKQSTRNSEQNIGVFEKKQQNTGD
jgi:hypothetical protein